MEPVQTKMKWTCNRKYTQMQLFPQKKKKFLIKLSWYLFPSSIKKISTLSVLHNAYRQWWYIIATVMYDLFLPSIFSTTISTSMKKSNFFYARMKVRRFHGFVYTFFVIFFKACVYTVSAKLNIHLQPGLSSNII